MLHMVTCPAKITYLPVSISEWPFPRLIVMSRLNSSVGKSAGYMDGWPAVSAVLFALQAR